MKWKSSPRAVTSWICSRPQEFHKLVSIPPLQGSHLVLKLKDRFPNILLFQIHFKSFDSHMQEKSWSQESRAGGVLLDELGQSIMLKVRGRMREQHCPRSHCPGPAMDAICPVCPSFHTMFLCLPRGTAVIFSYLNQYFQILPWNNLNRLVQSTKHSRLR